jgi:titin
MNQFGETASTARCTTPPAAPTIVSIRAATGGGLEVTWTDASSVEEGYEVQRANSEYQATTIATTAANATSYRDASAAPDVRYPYRVRAIKDGGYSDFSQWVEGMNATVVPDTPTGLTAYASGSTVVLVQWTASASTNGDGYRVERSANGGAWTTAATVAWAQQYIYDYDRTPDEEACYRVVAFNAKGDSPASTPDCARPIAAPTDLVATTAGSNAIDLAWSNHSAFAESYVVNRVECNYYYYEYCTVVETVTLGPDATSLRFTGLAPEGLYEFEVFAVASKNGSTYFSDPSNRAVGTTAP